MSNSASLILCESVLWEKNTELPSAIRILDTLEFDPSNTSAHFFALTILRTTSPDPTSHVLNVQLMGPTGAIVAAANTFEFKYGYKFGPSMPGLFVLSTEFNIRVTALGVHWMQAVLDGAAVAAAPLTLRLR